MAENTRSKSVPRDSTNQKPAQILSTNENTTNQNSASANILACDTIHMEISGIPSIQTGTKSPVEPAQETIAEPSRHSFHASLVTEPENLNVIQNVNIEHNVEELPELPLVTGEFKSVLTHMQRLVLSSEKRILQAVDRPGILQTIETVKTDFNKLLEEKI